MIKLLKGWALLVTVALILVLDRNWTVRSLTIPPLGKFFTPQNGCWQNAEDYNTDFNANLKIKGLKDKVSVYFEDRLVPHVFASNEYDAWLTQGFLHARFRLWQMELQTHAAAGRLSEITGRNTLENDREFRRLGMVYAAERTLGMIEKDPETKEMMDAYTKGVNTFIESLDYSSLPLEYKLMDYRPEPWTNLKTALFLQYMSYDLAGYDEDFEMTNARNFFSDEDFELLYPQVQDSLDPVIPKGTVFPTPARLPVAPDIIDTGGLNSGNMALNYAPIKPNPNNGSNNWAVSGKKTKSGAPILCNDPHLNLMLPSIWFEMQISIPGVNVYGASFPGAPGIMIGFNDSCAFGFTNGARDVRDYYSVRFRDKSRNEYWHNNQWNKTAWRIENIGIRGGHAFIDSVPYVKLGRYVCPVMYDRNYNGNRYSGDSSYAVLWKGHDAGDELRLFRLLNKAFNYRDYSRAVSLLKVPGQNCVFASKNGDIAIRAQGEYPAKWRGQGDFLMEGTDSSYLWQGMIPPEETLLQYNPSRNFVSSANQKSADDKEYPYYLGRHYSVFRGKIINRMLASMDNITPGQMMTMQTDNYNLFAEYARPYILKYLKVERLSKEEKNYFTMLNRWDLRNDPDSKGAVIFDRVWNELYQQVFEDEFEKAPDGIHKPGMTEFLQALQRDSNFKFIDNIETSGRETLGTLVVAAFKEAVKYLSASDPQGKMTWERYMATHVKHLSGLPSFSRMNVLTGGGNNCINATMRSHGPSWRMVVSLTETTEAWGIYPGGQSGNPGSRYYDDYINDWAAGKYYGLWMMNPQEFNSKKIRWTMTLKP